jgi:hypothetical protein
MPRLARFTPFALIETNGPILGQVHVIAAIGADRLLKIEIDRKLPSAVWLRYALSKLPRYVMGFGPPVSIVLNYREDFAVRHGLDGSVLEVLDQARLPRCRDARYGPLICSPSPCRSSLLSRRCFTAVERLWHAVWRSRPMIGATGARC